MTEDLAPTGEDTTTTDETQGGSDEVTQSSYEDRLNERIAEINSSIPDRVGQAVQDAMAQWQQSQAPAEEDGDEWTLEPDDDGYEDQELRRFLAEQIQQGVQAELAPMKQQQQLDQRNDAFAKLTETLPELKDATIATPIVQAAHDLVEGNEQLVNSPRFVELIEKLYKAAKADERAQQQTAADGRTTTLESQGGAAPHEPEESLDDRLAKKASSFNSF